MMTKVSFPASTLWMMASWLSLKASKPKCSCNWDSSRLDDGAFSLPFLLLTGFEFLVAVFFVAVVAMLKNFLPHLLSDGEGALSKYPEQPEVVIHKFGLTGELGRSVV